MLKNNKHKTKFHEIYGNILALDCRTKLQNFKNIKRINLTNRKIEM